MAKSFVNVLSPSDGVSCQGKDRIVLAKCRKEEDMFLAGKLWEPE